MHGTMSLKLGLIHLNGHTIQHRQRFALGCCAVVKLSY